MRASTVLKHHGAWIRVEGVVHTDAHGGLRDVPLKERGSVDRVVHERSGEVIPLELLGLSEEDALLHLVEANTKPL